MHSGQATRGTRCYDCWLENGWGGFANPKVCIDRSERGSSYWVSFISSNFASDWILNRRLPAQWWIIAKLNCLIVFLSYALWLNLCQYNNIALYGSNDVLRTVSVSKSATIYSSWKENDWMKAVVVLGEKSKRELAILDRNNHFTGTFYI